MTKVLLVGTKDAATFIMLCKSQCVCAEHAKAARERVYYLAKKGVIQRHGDTKRGQALWDLYELCEVYRQATILELP